MSYETSIGENQLIYQITLTGTPTLVKDLLSASDLNELRNWEVTKWPNKQVKNLEVLDGFIQPSATMLVKHKTTGVPESFSAGAFAYFPYLDWHNKIYVSGSGTAIVKFVIGFTRRPI